MSHFGEIATGTFRNDSRLNKAASQSRAEAEHEEGLRAEPAGVEFAEGGGVAVIEQGSSGVNIRQHGEVGRCGHQLVVFHGRGKGAGKFFPWKIQAPLQFTNALVVRWGFMEREAIAACKGDLRGGGSDVYPGDPHSSPSFGMGLEYDHTVNTRGGSPSW